MQIIKKNHTMYVCALLITLVILLMLLSACTDEKTNQASYDTPAGILTHLDKKIYAREAYDVCNKKRKEHYCFCGVQPDDLRAYYIKYMDTPDELVEVGLYAVSQETGGAGLPTFEKIVLETSGFESDDPCPLDPNEPSPTPILVETAMKSTGSVLIKEVNDTEYLAFHDALLEEDPDNPGSFSNLAYSEFAPEVRRLRDAMPGVHSYQNQKENAGPQSKSQVKMIYTFDETNQTAELNIKMVLDVVTDVVNRENADESLILGKDIIDTIQIGPATNKATVSPSRQVGEYKMQQLSFDLVHCAGSINAGSQGNQSYLVSFTNDQCTMYSSSAEGAEGIE